jgi:hypothetical protein
LEEGLGGGYTDGVLRECQEYGIEVTLYIFPQDSGLNIKRR